MGDYARAPRPNYTKKNFTKAVRETLLRADAVVVPLNGETYDVASSRIGPNIYRAARQLNAQARIIRSEDGLNLLVWLEPKA